MGLSLATYRLPTSQRPTSQLMAEANTTFPLMATRPLICREDISPIGDDLLVISEEFGWWEDARRRIDPLCIDKTARLAMVKLKRTEDGGHMELQAGRSRRRSYG